MRMIRILRRGLAGTILVTSLVTADEAQIRTMTKAITAITMKIMTATTTKIMKETTLKRRR